MPFIPLYLDGPLYVLSLISLLDTFHRLPVL